MKDNDLMYLDNIEERLDEDNIVTYRWLSLAINVSSNSAKQMLYNYYTKLKSSKERNICASYLLSGVCFDNELKQNIDKICVVQEDDLEEIKKEFQSLNSIHIFSLQKKQLKDIHVLYAADKDIIKENYENSKKLSAISAPSSFQGGTGIKTPKKEKISDTILPKEPLSNGFDKNSHKPPPKSEIPNISSLTDEKPNQLKSIKNDKQNIFTKKSPEKKTKSFPPSKTSISAKGKTSTAAAKGKTSTIASMFAKQAVSAPPTKEKISTTKQNGFHESKTNNKEIEDKEKKSEEKCEQKEAVEKVTKRRSPSPISQKTKPPVPKKPKLSPQKRGKKRTAGRPEVEPKRMRILAPDSSSEEDEKEEEIIIDEECPLPTSYQECTETTQGDSTTRCGRWVDKTYESDDGFLVTQKEFEIVESVENEESPLPWSPKKSEKLSPQKKREKSSAQKRREKSSPQKRREKPSPSTAKSAAVKQASIISFFKRK